MLRADVILEISCFSLRVFVEELANHALKNQ